MGAMSDAAATVSAGTAEPVRAALFGPGRRATTVGLVLLTLVTAFEAMGVGTAMPAVIADLGAVSAYGWPFSAFLAASVFGTVLGGRWCDSTGPRAALLVTPVVFAAGLVVAGTADTLAQLLVGRVLQGASAERSSSPCTWPSPRSTRSGPGPPCSGCSRPPGCCRR